MIEGISRKTPEKRKQHTKRLTRITIEISPHSRLQAKLREENLLSNPLILPLLSVLQLSCWYCLPFVDERRLVKCKGSAAGFSFPPHPLPPVPLFALAPCVRTTSPWLSLSPAKRKRLLRRLCKIQLMVLSFIELILIRENLIHVIVCKHMPVSQSVSQPVSQSVSHHMSAEDNILYNNYCERFSTKFTCLKYSFKFRE